MLKTTKFPQGGAVLDIEGVKVAFDAFLSTDPLLSYQPPPPFQNAADATLIASQPRLGRPVWSADYVQSDALFISSVKAFYGLPYLTERLGYVGQIYAMEPTVFFARRILLELAVLAEESGVPDVVDSDGTITVYTVDEVNKCFEKVNALHYGEETSVLEEVFVTGFPSGFEIGGTAWRVETLSRRVAYLGEFRTDASYAVCMDFDRRVLEDVEGVVFGRPDVPADTLPYTARMDELMKLVRSCVASSTNVVIPMLTTDLLFEVLELLNLELNRMSKHVPVFVVSHAAHDVFQYSNIISEWVSTVERNKRVFDLKDTFTHQAMLRAGTLRYFDTAAVTPGPALPPTHFANAFRQPCILFASHPSCRMGDVTQFLRLMSFNKMTNTIVVDPDYCQQSVLNPYAISCGYIVPLNRQSPRMTLGDVREMPEVSEICAKFCAGRLDPKLADKLEMRPLRVRTEGKVMVGHIKASAVCAQDGLWYVRGEPDPSRPAIAGHYTLPTEEEFVAMMKKVDGFLCVRKLQNHKAWMVYQVCTIREHAVVMLGAEETVVVCRDDGLNREIKRALKVDLC